MVTIDEQMLADHGIQLPQDGADEFLDQLQAQVEERVGMAIIEKLDDDHAKELLKMTEAGADADQIADWLTQNMPDYEAVVDQAVDEILDDVADNQQA